MKKLLRNITLAALVAAPAFNAQAEMTLTEQWTFQSTEIGDTWKNATNTGSNVRFVTAKDGKFYAIDMAKKAIITFNKEEGIKTYKELTLPEGITVLGSSISFDTAGNIVFNYNFVQASPSPSQAWAVYNPTTGEVANYTIPAEDCMVQRVDHMGRLVGDATSAEGAYGYAFGATAAYPLVYHFTGDGTKMTKVTCAPLADGKAIDGFNLAANSWAQPSFESVADMTAAPEISYYATATSTQVCTMESGSQVNFGPAAGAYGTLPIGNAGNGGFDTFTMGGKRYFVRSYMDTWKPYSSTHIILNFAVFDETGTVVAMWQNSTWEKASGYSTIIAEKVNEGQVDIYAYVTSGNGAGMESVMCTLIDDSLTPKPGDDIKGSGTEADPYQIATAEDLCNAWTKRQLGGIVYFEQTADIDMGEIKKYIAVNGFDGQYNSAIHYDGKNHIIKNFHPIDQGVEDSDPVLGNNYYAMSVFGIVSGTVKNVGIIDANVVVNKSEKVGGIGILCGVIGHGSAPAGYKEGIIDNCFVTGKVESQFDYAGGLTGATYNETKISNSYANVEVVGKNEAAAIVGRANYPVTLTNVYAAGTVKSTAKTACLIATQREGKTSDITFDNVIAMNTGSDKATNIATVNGTAEILTEGQAAFDKIQAWEAFNAKKMLGGVPTLNWVDVEGAGIDSIVADEDENAPVEYFNLQGVRVENPTNGLYIKRQGNKVSKVVIR